MKFIYLTILIMISSSYCLAKSPPSYTEIDLEIINNLPFITLQIENKLVKILLDTGARNKELVLNSEIISTLNTLATFPVKFKSVDITGKSYLAKKYILPKFNISNIEFLQVELEEDTNWGLTSAGSAKSQQKDGVAGLALFKNKAIIIDYPKNKLVIIDKKYPTHYDIDNWQSVEYKIDLYGLAIYASIDDSSEVKRFILDSGSNISLIKPKSIGNNKISHDCNVILQPNSQCSLIKSERFLVNKINYQNIFFYIYNFLEPIADGILGYDFLVDKMLYIDFDKRIMKMKPVASGA